MDAQRISVDEVRRRLERGDEILFLDTRSPKDWAAADEKLPLALRMSADEVPDHLAELPHDGPIIAYCS
jgi:rhodanese-related sulfurtransferase